MNVRIMKTSDLIGALINPDGLIDWLEKTHEIVSDMSRAETMRVVNKAIQDVCDELDRRIPVTE